MGRLCSRRARAGSASSFLVGAKPPHPGRRGSAPRTPLRSRSLRWWFLLPGSCSVRGRLRLLALLGSALRAFVAGVRCRLLWWSGFLFWARRVLDAARHCGWGSGLVSSSGSVSAEPGFLFGLGWGSALRAFAVGALLSARGRVPVVAVADFCFGLVGGARRRAPLRLEVSPRLVVGFRVGCVRLLAGAGSVLGAGAFAVGVLARLVGGILPLPCSAFPLGSLVLRGFAVGLSPRLLCRVPVVCRVWLVFGRRLPCCGLLAVLATGWAALSFVVTNFCHGQVCARRSMAIAAALCLGRFSGGSQLGLCLLWAVSVSWSSLPVACHCHARLSTWGWPLRWLTALCRAPLLSGSWPGWLRVHAP
jgi:hypothetical protein